MLSPHQVQIGTSNFPTIPGRNHFFGTLATSSSAVSERVEDWAQPKNRHGRRAQNHHQYFCVTTKPTEHIIVRYRKFKSTIEVKPTA